ncbi:MAG: transcriptional regulator, Crp/Fnr family [Tardiphaga sp.]|jgi:CRP-like cAMP-binding protein|uniref:Crp/Fnr family transcriptional regulator n=1 Tax=Tardiphaga sp. TaxID=1926292 RepID=UPI00262D6FBB|nr:Crp/Fnr family transcriptional regulator [Tardiphaga sp.]MDB5504186.1 transcriptional regulator, Crp/Fnr family [Tardiphaga sp.]
MTVLPSFHGSNHNHLLARLSVESLGLITHHSAVVAMKQGTVLYEAGEEVEHVYFPHSGMVSLLAVMQNGKAIETATVGREGVVGAMAGLGLYTSMVRAVVQLPMSASKISAARFRHAVAASKSIEHACIRYNEVLLTQARVTAACNALHPVDERFCRWLLQSADRAESNTVALTQELLSEMLGVRRTSVTEVAGKLQRDGIISFTRGIIQIIDRPGLEALTCECYQSLIDQSATLGRQSVVVDSRASDGARP